MLQKLKEDTLVAERLKNKYLYKIELILLKFIPLLLAIVCLLNSILSYFCIDLPILSYIGGISIFTLLFLYLSSYVFGFCFYHRMFLHYITITWILNTIDCYIGIPVGDFMYLCLQLSIAGISLFIILYLHVKNTKKSTCRDSR